VKKKLEEENEARRGSIMKIEEVTF